MMHKEDARPVEGEWKHLLWKIFKQEKRVDRERERESKRRRCFFFGNLSHRKLKSNKGQMS